MDAVRMMEAADDLQTVLNAYLILNDTDPKRPFIRVHTENLPAGHFRISRAISDSTDHAGRFDRDDEGNFLPVHSGGIIGEIVATPEPKLISNLVVENDPIFGNLLSSYRSLMAAPLLFGDHVGSWVIVFSTQQNRYTPQHLENHIVRASMLMNHMRAAMITEELRRANAWIHNEVNDIAQLQRTMLPKELPQTESFRCVSHYNTFHEAGGDYFDLIPLGDGTDSERSRHWVILLADAAGHGPAAATLIAILHAFVQAAPIDASGPAEFLENLNTRLRSTRLRQTLITAFAAYYDSETCELRYALAGHPAPIVHQKGGPHHLNQLDKGRGFPLGIVERVACEEETFTLDHDTSLVLYTDGIMEAAGPGGELFGSEGIQEAIANVEGDEQTILDRILAAVEHHQQDLEPQDDQTMLVIKPK